MVTDTRRAEALICGLMGYKEPSRASDLDLIVSLIENVRKERDDLWRKKVVEIQKINADAGRQALLEAEGELGKV